MMFDRFWCGWFPDLRRVEASARREVLWAAYQPARKSPKYVVITLGTQLAAQAFLALPANHYARVYGYSGVVIDFVLPFAAALIAAIYAILLIRRRITLDLRKQLVARGLPTCVRCGYDLTGNVSGVCSECGTAAKPS
jgi:hypothetical protein